MKNYEDTRILYDLKERELNQTTQYNIRNLQMSVSATNYDGELIDLTGYYEWNATWLNTSYDTSTEDLSWSTSQISSHPCSEKEFQENFPDQPPGYYHIFTCFDDLSKGIFQGSQTSANKKYFRARFHICQNKTETDTCKSDKEREIFLKENPVIKIVIMVSSEAYDQN